MILRIGTSAILLQPGVYDVGRDLSCRICLDDANTSRRHALFHVLQNCDVFLEDLASRNGTLVNGMRIISGRKVLLSPGDSVQIGQHLITCEGPGELSPGRPPITPPAPSEVSPIRPDLTAMRSCPACRHLARPEVPVCPNCGYDRDRNQAASGHPTVTTLDVTPGRPRSDVVILSPDVAFLQGLAQAGQASDDLGVIVAQTLDEVIDKLERRPRLVLVDAELAQQGLRKWHDRLPKVPFGIFGAAPEAIGATSVVALGAEFYVQRPVSPILFIAKTRFWLARLRRE